jgi:DNA-directed RNA polymerase specialized sigma24 family protein
MSYRPILRLTTAQRMELSSRRAAGLSLRQMSEEFWVSEEEARQLLKRGWVKPERR